MLAAGFRAGRGLTRALPLTEGSVRLLTPRPSRPARRLVVSVIGPYWYVCRADHRVVTSGVSCHARRMRYLSGPRSSMNTVGVDRKTSSLTGP